MRKRLKGCFCPSCKKKIFRRRSIKRNHQKPTKCSSCGFEIKNPYEIFIPKPKQ